MSVYHRDDPELFAAALDSILSQHFTQEVESRIYLAVDGPISGNLQRVIDERANSIYRVARIESNRGLANALNTLIAQLDDEVFVFRMDADDVSMPTRFQAQLDRMRSDPGVDILGTDIMEIDAASGQRRRVAFAQTHEEALSRMSWRVPVAHPTVCFRRAVLQCIQAYPDNGTNEDVAMWFLCARAGFRFGNVRKPLLIFHIGPGFWRRRSFEKAFVELKCYLHGIWLLHGITWRYILPIFRFGLRLAPRSVSRWAYSLKSLRAP
jgi:glycosyltransferase involved in cell wall biosynthesis